MNRSSPSGGAAPPDWDALYRERTPPWETGMPAEELASLLGEGMIKPCRTLELGCGTGANAVLLARHGFEVTAVDSSPTAIERARTRAEQSSVLLRFVLDDLFSFSQTSGSFDFVLDVGFYHFMRRIDLNQLLDLLWRVTHPGSLYLALAGSAEELAEGGPPRVSDEEIRCELGRLFETVQLRRFRFQSPVRPEGFLGWSCLMRRPNVGPRISHPT